MTSDLHVKRRLPEGVSVRQRTPLPDRRGTFTEVFRAEWDDVAPRQWNSIVTKGGGILRGVKVHLRNDHFAVLQLGRVTVGFRDVRLDSPTEGLAATLDVDASSEIRGITIPRGIAHGFYFHEPSVLLIGDTSYYDPGDQLRCHWADPNLGIPWPVAEAITSDEDAAGLSFAEFVALAAREQRA